MKKRVATIVLFTLLTSSIKGQDIDYQNNASYSSAYMEGSHAAHWSAYIPLTILVVAAIYMGLSDQKHTDISSSSYYGHSSEGNNYNGLGSLANSPSGWAGSSWSGSNLSSSSWGSIKPSSSIYSSSRSKMSFSH